MKCIIVSCYNKFLSQLAHVLHMRCVCFQSKWQFYLDDGAEASDTASSSHSRADIPTSARSHTGPGVRDSAKRLVSHVCVCVHACVGIYDFNAWEPISSPHGHETCCEGLTNGTHVMTCCHFLLVCVCVYVCVCSCVYLCVCLSGWVLACQRAVRCARIWSSPGQFVRRYTWWYEQFTF